MSSIVLDASALMALIADEKGCDVVEKHLANCIMFTVNIAETICGIMKKGASFEEAESIVDGLIHHKEDFTGEHAKTSSKLINYTKPHGLSLGDRACLSLAICKKRRC